MPKSPVESPHLQCLETLWMRQSQLLDEIKSSDHGPLVHSDAEKRKTVAFLQEKYNRLVDEAIELQPTLYTDPLRSLPFELWISIIDCLLLDTFDTFHRDPDNLDIFHCEQYAVNQLLNLTGVSKTWSAALLSVPSFWTTVVLDSNDEDCLAKAVTSIQLSGALKLNVLINVPLYAWGKMAAIIVSHGERIRTLTLLGQRTHLRQQPSGLSDILISFGHLPALRDLHLHSRRTRSILPDSEYPSETVNSLILNRFPSLQTVTGFRLKPDVVSSLSHSGIRSININGFDGRLITALMQFSDLQHLDFVWGWGSTGQKPSHTLRLPLLSIVAEFNYIREFNFVLMYVGQDLREVHLQHVDVRELLDLFIYLQRFQITHIRLALASYGVEYPDVPESCCLPTIKFLELRVDGEIEDNGRHWSDAMFRTLVSVMPSVESFVLKGNVSLRSSLQYFQTLPKLRILVLHCNLDTPIFEPFPFVGQLLEHLDWAGKPPTRLFNQLQCPLLLTLSLSDHSMSHEVEYQSSIRLSSPALVWDIPMATTSSVTSLSLAMRYPIHFGLASFPAVTRVCLTHSIWISDFFEELLLRPHECPNLENIIVEGSYLEWDVLLLMLERRNVTTRSGVASIKSIQFMLELPFKLLHAISDLLRGKYLVDIRIAEFSIGAVSKRMCNQSKTGCFRCCEFLRECDSPAQRGWSSWDYEPFGWRYSLPSTIITPEPTLSPGLSHWMSGKMARRVAFARNALLAEVRFGRLDDCERGARNPRRVVTAFSMEFD